MAAYAAFITPVAIVAWMASNVGVLLLNKFLLTSTGFKQPVFLTLCHMLACCGLSYALSFGALFPIRPLRSRAQAAKVCLLAAIFCVTIVLGNLSLKHIAVSFSQAVGSATPFFTALFALALQGSRESALTYAALVPIVAGVVVSSGGEPDFHLLGFVACVAATAGRALKSVVQAMLLADPAEKLDPMSLLFYMSSVSVLLLLPAAALLEPGAFAAAAELAGAKGGFLLWLALNSATAYAVNLTNFIVTKHTSALTLQVLGNLKGVVAAGVSVALFRNAVTARGAAGYAVTVAGVFAYSAARRRAAAMRAAEAARAVDIESSSEPLLVKAAAAAAAGLSSGGGSLSGSSSVGGGGSSYGGSDSFSFGSVGGGRIGSGFGLLGGGAGSADFVGGTQQLRVLRGSGSGSGKH